MKSNRAIDIKGFCALLEGGERFLLVCHIHPDGDTLGSAMAMARILRLMGKNASVFCDIFLYIIGRLPNRASEAGTAAIFFSLHFLQNKMHKKQHYRISR